MLPLIDGLDQPQDGGNIPASLQYEGSLGEFQFDEMPLAIQRQYSPDKVHAHDASASVILASTEQQPLNVHGDGPFCVVHPLSRPLLETQPNK